MNRNAGLQDVRPTPFARARRVGSVTAIREAYSIILMCVPLHCGFFHRKHNGTTMPGR